MSRTYMYVRRTGTEGTKVMQMTRRAAMKIIRQHRGSEYQLGVLGGRDLRTISMVYGEFIPYVEVKAKEELFG